MEKRIEDYQLKELYDNHLFINQYSLDLMYEYELNRYWKEFMFDLTERLGVVYSFEYLKNNYNKLISDNKIADLDFRDYVELNDYISITDWLDKGNNIEYRNDGIYLIGA